MMMLSCAPSPRGERDRGPVSAFVVLGQSVPLRVEMMYSRCSVSCSSARHARHVSCELPRVADAVSAADQLTEGEAGVVRYNAALHALPASLTHNEHICIRSSAVSAGSRKMPEFFRLALAIKRDEFPRDRRC